MTYLMTNEDFQRARDDRRLTNCEIAKIVGVSESYICKIMRGHRPVTREIREKFFRALGLPEPQDVEKSA